MNEYKVDGKVFKTILYARQARKEIKASLPNDAVVTIFRKEECAPIIDNGHPGFMWVPFE